MVDQYGRDPNMELRSAVPRHKLIEEYLATFDVVILQESKVEKSPFTGLLSGWKWESIPCRSKKCVGMLFGHRKSISSTFEKGTIKSSSKAKDGTRCAGSESQWISAQLKLYGCDIRVVTLYRHKFTKFKEIESAIGHLLGNDCPTLFIGDMNVRIGSYGAWPDKEKNRNCRDKTTEGPFRDFLELVENNKLIILNGQTNGDEAGEFTNDGKTTIDYAAVNEKLHKSVVEFKVDTEISGNKAHSPLTLHLLLVPPKTTQDPSEEIDKMLKNIRISTGEKQVKRPNKQLPNTQEVVNTP